MKIRMSITLEVNEEKWANEYGLQHGNVREDATEHMRYLVRGTVENIPHIVDGLVTVTRFE